MSTTAAAPATASMSAPAISADQLAAHFAEFREQGYTVLPGLHSAERMARWRHAYPELCRRAAAGGDPVWWLADTVELDPELMLPAVADPRLLDFTELVLGPRVQLDNLTYAAFGTLPVEHAGKVSGWHRDIWSHCPTEGVYHPPMAINAISYLQDLDPSYGGLRVIPRSHRRELFIAPDQRGLPHPDEVVLYPRAGDVVFTHSALWHSGSLNTSGHPRHFMSAYYNLTCMHARDSHAGPLTQALVARARARGDRRTMRLFGADDLRIARGHGLGMEPDEKRWELFRAEDAAVLRKPDRSGQTIIRM